MKFFILLLTLIANVSCLAENDKPIDCTRITISAEYDDCIKKKYSVESTTRTKN